MERTAARCLSVTRAPSCCYARASYTLAVDNNNKSNPAQYIMFASFMKRHNRLNFPRVFSTFIKFP